MAPKAIWGDFVSTGVVRHAAKHGNHEEDYDTWQCPHCDGVVEIMASSRNRKAVACALHFWNTRNPCPKRPDTDLRGKKVPKSKHEDAPAVVIEPPVVGQPLEAQDPALQQELAQARLELARERITSEQRRQELDAVKSSAEPMEVSLPIAESAENATETVSVETNDEFQEALSVVVPIAYTVYGLRYRPMNVLVYVGSTKDQSRRFGEHSNLTSGCRRLSIALCQKSVQPFGDFFCLEELWTGLCTGSQARAIEQCFIDKHHTRVWPRPTNGITRDIDLINGGPPLQLNVAQACKDPDLLQWAMDRIAQDSQIVKVRTPYEELALKNLLAEILLDGAETLCDITAPSKLVRVLALFEALDPEQAVPVTEVHRALLQLHAALSVDDGEDLKELVAHNMKLFNADHSPDRHFRASVVCGLFRTLAACVGI